MGEEEKDVVMGSSLMGSSMSELTGRNAAAMVAGCDERRPCWRFWRRAKRRYWDWKIRRRWGGVGSPSRESSVVV